MKRLRTFPKAVMGWLSFSVLALLVALCSFVLLRPPIRARYLFSQIKTLELEHSTFEDAERLARKIGAEPYGACDRSYCEWDAEVDNARIPKWWRGLGETFRVSFTVRDSIVVRKNTGFGTGTRAVFHPSAVSVEEQRHWGRGNTPEPIAAGWSTTDLFVYYRFGVKMTPQASTEDRRRYTAFDYSCFWRFRGCRDARDLLPTADPFPEDLRLVAR
jgi:hypothetical protein